MRRFIDTALLAVDLVLSPNQTIPGQTVGDVWNGHIATMGSGSDFTAFQDFAGIPSLDMGFGAGRSDPVYHYHSNYDSFDWMNRFGDPSYAYHETIAKLLALVAARLVEIPVIQFNATEYAKGLSKYVESVKSKAHETNLAASSNTADVKNETLFRPLDLATSRLHFTAVLHDARAASLLETLQNEDIPWWKFWELAKLWLAIRDVNTKYKLLERRFLYAEGLDDRPWFKHVIFAPGRWTGYAGATFPGIVEGLEDKDSGTVEKWVNIIAGKINAAADWLEE